MSFKKIIFLFLIVLIFSFLIILYWKKDNSYSTDDNIKFGIRNVDLNCYMSALIQLLFHSKYREKILHTEKKSLQPIKKIFEIVLRNKNTSVFNFISLFNEFLEPRYNSFVENRLGDLRSIFFYLANELAEESFLSEIESYEYWRDENGVLKYSKTTSNSNIVNFYLSRNQFFFIGEPIRLYESNTCKYFFYDNIRQLTNFYTKELKKIKDLVVMTVENMLPNKDIPIFDKIIDKDGKELILKGVIIYIPGGIAHYIAIIKINNEWYKFNDSSVEKITFENLCRYQTPYTFLLFE